MCFSATVSFGASAVLGSLGYASFKTSQSPSLKILALTIIFFCCQQFIEGWLWIVLLNPHADSSIFWTPILTKLFLVFAWVVWPFFIPYFMYQLEKNTERKAILKRGCLIGLFVSMAMVYILFNVNIQASIDGHHILYERFARLPGILVLSSIYVSLLLFPFFVTTTRHMLTLGVVNVLFFLIASWFFKTHLISVWCFFAAISSTYIYYIVFKLKDFYPQSSHFLNKASTNPGRYRNRAH